MTRIGPKMVAARKATDQILDQIEQAEQRLKSFDGRIVNGAGILTDTFSRRVDLGAAIRALQEAHKVMEATAWPVDADYDAWEDEVRADNEAREHK